MPRALVLIAALAGSYGLAVLVARPHVPDPASNPYTGKRGASLARSAGLSIRYRRSDELRAVDPQTLLRAGDRLELTVRADGPTYLEVRFRDGTSAPRTIFPAGAATTPRVNGGDTLSVAPAVGAGQGKVVVTAIFSDGPRAAGTPVSPADRAITAVLSKESVVATSGAN